MKSNSLGAFEELVLLTIGALNDEAYGVSIKKELAASSGKNPSIGALHSALSRLEEKGYISSFEGGATQKRGGRRKRFYQITGAGKEALIRRHQLRSDLLNRIPNLKLDTGNI